MRVNVRADVTHQLHTAALEKSRQTGVSVASVMRAALRAWIAGELRPEEVRTELVRMPSSKAKEGFRAAVPKTLHEAATDKSGYTGVTLTHVVRCGLASWIAGELDVTAEDLI